jgi:hypothetical protein
LKAKLAAAEAKVLEADARSAAVTASMKAVTAGQRKALLEQNRDRVAPTMLAEVEAYGAFCGDDLGKFEAFVKSLPGLTRATRESGTDLAETVMAAAAGVESIVGNTGLGGVVGAKQVERWLGTSTAKINAYAKVKAFHANGKFELTDGRMVSRSELKKAIGLQGA